VKPRKAKTLMRRASAGGGIEAERRVWTLLLAARDELRKMAKEGLVDADAAEKYHPVRTLIRIENDLTIPPVIRLAAAKEILQYVEAPKSAVMRLDAADAAGGPIQINVMVADWAKGPNGYAPSPQALPAPEPIDHEEASHGDMKTPPTPQLSDRTRLQKMVEATPAVPIYEVSADPSKPKELIGEMSQAKGYLGKEEIMERLSKGRPS
jgi:hypothetical protein